MAETTVETPTPEPAPTPKSRQRGDINREHLEELKSSQTVADAALDPNYAAALTAVELDANLPTLIQIRAQIVADKLARLKGSRTDKREMTAQEKAARDALIAVIAPIQTAARRKFTGDTAIAREAYYIGSSLASDSLDVVSIAAKNILARLVPGPNNAPAQDTLPGITADGKIKELQDAVALYATRDKEQGKKQNEAEKLLEEIREDVKQLANMRRQVQLAADQAWPWRSNGVASIRKAFLLPTDRPLGI